MEHGGKGERVREGKGRVCEGEAGRYGEREERGEQEQVEQE